MITNNFVDDTDDYDIYYDEVYIIITAIFAKAKNVVGLLVISSVVGALTGFGLSFTPLSPLIIGGVIGAVFPALIATSAIIIYCYLHYNGSSLLGKCMAKSFTPCFSAMAITTIAAGMILTATASIIFPGAMSGMISTPLTSGIVETVALFAGIIIGKIVTKKFAENLPETTFPKYSLDCTQTAAHSTLVQNTRLNN